MPLKTLAAVTMAAAVGYFVATRETFSDVTAAAAGATESAAASAATRPADGKPLYGTPHTPHNLPIAYWEASIRERFGVQTIVDVEGTARLQSCLRNEGGVCPKWTSPYVVFGEVSYAIYYARPGDPEYVAYGATSTGAATSNAAPQNPNYVEADGSRKPCTLDVGRPWAGKIRIPAHAMRWDSVKRRPISVEPGTAATTDIHFTIVDEERNRVYAFYSYGGHVLGVFGDKWASSHAACDLLSGSDAEIEEHLAPGVRYGCPGGQVYAHPGAPTRGPGCGLDGIGAGLPAGGNGNGDSLGYIGPHGVIVPEDFDDTGWTGDAVGTLHHALRYSMPDEVVYGFMWPMKNPDPLHTVARDATQPIRMGQMMRLDPAYDCAAATGGANPTAGQRAQRRICRTLQVYGAVNSDYARYGPALFAVSSWPGTGRARSPAHSPWAAAAGANAEAVAFARGLNRIGVKRDVLPSSAIRHLQMILPHGASYPPRDGVRAGAGTVAPE